MFRTAFVLRPLHSRPTTTAFHTRRLCPARPAFSMSAPTNSTPKQLAPSAAEALLASETPPLYVDVRTADEYAAGRIAPPSVNVPIFASLPPPPSPSPSFVSDVRAALAAHPSQSAIIGCKSGRRSANACQLLLDAGVEADALSELAGGFDAWAADGLPVQSD